ncbi:Cytochrome c oxidase assembly protein cox11, mitochondrial [Geranomyces variabilis]|nr:Cytochrome c oxidase assembly protein cox11, mitochondrial [Geranomyces variabilis]
MAAQPARFAARTLSPLCHHVPLRCLMRGPPPPLRVAVPDSGRHLSSRSGQSAFSALAKAIKFARNATQQSARWASTTPPTDNIPAPPPGSPIPTSSKHSQPSYSDARSRYERARAHDTRTTMYYTASVIVLFIGASYAAVPLYKLICTTTGLDGTPMTSPGHKFEPESMKPVPNAQKIRIRFASSVSDHMRWSFTPVTPEIHIVPGETALAFYTAHNPTNEDIVGISTYSVVPAKAAQYFNKIQCFCFEEQKLEADEEVDMPVFFYIDPEFAYDPWMKDVKTITLHYTFFKSKSQ